MNLAAKIIVRIEELEDALFRAQAIGRPKGVLDLIENSINLNRAMLLKLTPNIPSKYCQ